MKISKQAWHYRLNSSVQGWQFEDRVQGRRLTTCTYIRTTLRSILQRIFEAFWILLAVVLAVIALCCALYLPVAALFGLVLPAAVKVIGTIIWSASGTAAVIILLQLLGQRLLKREASKLSILEQRIKDGREGICTIVEVA